MSDIEPFEFNVLVRQDPVEEKTKGGLILAESTKEREKHMATKGTIVSLAPLAFNADIWPKDMDRPRPGDRVLFSKHAGLLVEQDGDLRLLKDRDVLAGLPA